MKEQGSWERGDESKMVFQEQPWTGEKELHFTDRRKKAVWFQQIGRWQGKQLREFSSDGLNFPAKNQAQPSVKSKGKRMGQEIQGTGEFRIVTEYDVGEDADKGHVGKISRMILQ